MTRSGGPGRAPAAAGGSRHTVLRVLWRFVSGAHLDGQVRTDAGWLRPGTRPVHGYLPALRWCYLPRLRRAWWRLSTVAVLSGWTALYVAHPTLAVVVLVLAAAGAGGTAGWRAWQRVRRWHHDRAVVIPLYSAAGAILGWPGGERPDQLVRVPLDYTAKDARVGIAIPDHWHGTDEQKHALRALVERRLGGEWDAHWHLGRSPMRVEFTPAPAPPSVVTFARVLAEIKACPEGVVVLGLGTRGEPIRHSFDAEAPHLGASIGTGGGKSTILRGIIAQMLHAAAELPDGVDGPSEVVVIDPKHISLECLDGVPGVRICTDIEEQWAAIREFRAMMENRYRIRKSDRGAVFRRRLLILEEQNTFAAKSYQHWSEIKSSKDRAKPPVFDDIATIAFEGRQAVCNIVGVYQQMNARATGGSDLRDQYGAKVLARFSQQAWGFLVGTHPRPRSSKHPGRGVVVLGDEHNACQFIFWTEDEARRYALRGRTAAVSVRPLEGVLVSPDRPCVLAADTDTAVSASVQMSSPGACPPGGTGSLHQGRPAAASRDSVSARTRPVPAAGRPHLVALPSVPAAVVVGLQAAADHLGLSFAAFEKARQRARREGSGIPAEFVRDGSPAWPADALTKWQRSRPRAGARKVG